MGKLLFSIVIPVCNVEDYLVECLESVVKQTYKCFEVICINDGSTDKSYEILEKYSYEHSNFFILNQENRGLSFSRNVGVKRATGDILLFLDSDDYLEANTLELISNSYSGEDMVCFNGTRFLPNGTIDEKDEAISIEKLNGWDYYNYYSLKQQSFHFVSVVLRAYKRTFLISNNLFFHEGIFHEDNLFTPMACYYANYVKVIPYYLYNYRIRPGSITQTYDVKRLIDSIIVANLLYEFFINKSIIEKSVIYRVISGEYFKGFMIDYIQKYGNNDKLLRSKINWQYFKTVSLYPRHRRIFLIARFSPKLLRMYLFVEFHIKKLLNR